MLELRDYQSEAVDAYEAAVAEGIKRPAIVLPTGAGKTVVFAHVANSAIRQGRQPIVLVHRDELAQQAARKLSVITGKHVGIVKAESDEHDAPAVVASVQTLARAARRLMFGIDVDRTIIVDECHHATAKSYIDTLTYFGAFDPQSSTTALGVTATMQRGDGTRLGRVWEKIVYQRDIPWMIREGWLTDVKGIRLVVEDLDTSGVRTTAGDYNEGDLGEALAASSSPVRVAEKYAEECRTETGYLPGILFAPTVETARLFAQAFSAHGIRAEAILGAMPVDERRRILNDYERGELDMLCNCMVLTEGFDSPRAQVCVIARQTASAPLYIQMVGRVLRPFPHKQYALVIDVVGASALHALTTLATLAGRDIVPRQGQTLLEAIDQSEAEEAERLGRPSVYREDRLVVEEVDLFHGSRIAWKQTALGYWFISAGQRYIVIVPASTPGEHDIMWLPKAGRGGGWLGRNIPDLVLAMSYAERDVTIGEHMTAMKERAWRKRPASNRMLAYARQLRVDVESLPDARAGTVSAAIDVKLATSRIDPTLARYLAASGLTSA